MDNESHLRRYRLDAAEAFQQMRTTTDRDFIGFLFNLEVDVEEFPPPDQPEQRRRD